VTRPHSEVLDRHRGRLQAIEADNDLPSNFAELLDHAVNRDGKKATIDFFDQAVALTAAEFRNEVYRVADGFCQVGIGHGSFVGVMMPNRVEFPITWMALGVLGAVMVPVNPASTGAELDHVFLDTGVTHLVVQDDLVEAARTAKEWMATRQPGLVPVAAGLARGPNAVPEHGSWEALRALGDPGFRPDRAALPQGVLVFPRAA